MNASERKERLERRVIHPATYRVRHDNDGGQQGQDVVQPELSLGFFV